MAVTFKSNQVATQYIKDVSGYSGPKDFTANASFADDLFVDADWNQIGLTSIVSTIRQSQASILKSSNLNDYEIINNDVARVSYIPDHNSKGLISSNWSSSILSSTLATSVNLTADSIVYALFTTDNLGSIDIDANPNISILAGTGTFKDPVYFKVNSSTTLNLVRRGGAQAAHLMIATSGQTPFLPNYEFIGINPDSLNLNTSKINSKFGAVIFKFASPTRKYNSYTGLDQNFPLFLLKQDSENYVAAYIDKDGYLNTRLYSGNTQKFFISSSFAIDRSSVNAIGVSWDSGKIKISMNGANYVLFSERSMQGDFNVNSLKLGGSLESWITTQSEMAFFNLITYNRALEIDELNKATQF